MQEDLKKYKTNVYKVFLFKGLMKFHVWLPIYVLYLQDARGLSLASIALLEAIGGAVAAASEIPTGFVADRYGRKYSMALGAALVGIVLMIYGFAGYLPILFTLHMIWMFASGFISGADQALLYDSLKTTQSEEQFAKLMGRNMAIMSASGAIAGVIGGYLAHVYLGLPFLVSGIGVVLAAIIALSMEEPPYRSEGKRKERVGFLSLPRVMLHTFRNKKLRALVILSVTLYLPAFLFTFLFLTQFLKDHEVPVYLFGLVFLLIQCVGIAGSLLTPIFQKRFGNKSLVLFKPVSMAIVMLFIQVDWFIVGMMSILTIELIYGAIAPIVSAEINDQIESEHRATSLSVISLLTTGFMAIGLPVSGFLIDHFGFTGVCILFSFTSLLVFIYVRAMYMRQTEKVENKTIIQG